MTAAATSSSSSSLMAPEDDSFLSPVFVEAQAKIEEDLRRAREQEEADRKMALKLQRLFQKEQYEEMTKRPEGYGTRAGSASRSPLSRSADADDLNTPETSAER